MKNILVPIDFSENSLKAFLYAGNIAQKSGGTIFLLHVIEPAVSTMSQPIIISDQYLFDVEEQRKRQMQEALNLLQQNAKGITIKTFVVHGTVFHAIKVFVHQHSIQLIVMGTKGASGLKEIFVGSVTATTIAASEIPVLAIPENFVVGQMRTILFATRSFEKDTFLLRSIVELAILFSASVHVAVFLDNGEAGVEDHIDNALQLKAYIDFLKNRFPDVEFMGRLLHGDKFEESVNEYDQNKEIDLIAMITYPKGFWENLLKGSVTKKMAFHSKIPVLAIPAIPVYEAKMIAD